MEGQLIKRETVEKRIREGYSIDIGKIIGDSFELLKDNFGILIGSTVLLILISSVLSFTFFGIFLLYVLTMGHALLILNLIQNKRAEVSDLFAYFSGGKLWSLIGFYVVLFLLTLVAIIPFGLAFVPTIMATSAIENNSISDSFHEVLAGASIFMLIISFLLLFVGVILVIVGTFFTPYLIALGDYDLKEAFIKSWQLAKKNFLTLFLFIIVASILGALGVMVCYVGLIFTIPLQYIMYVHLVEKVLISDETSEIDEIGTTYTN